MKTREQRRKSTGIDGLDHVLGGGLPADRMYLISGDPGVGKTTLGLQFLLKGADVGESGLYFTLSESEEEIRDVAISHRWDLNKISLFELSAARQALSASEDNTVFHPAEVELPRVVRTPKS